MSRFGFLLLASLVGASSVHAQAAVSDDAVIVEPAARRAALRAELEQLDTTGPDFALEVGAQLVFYACIATTLGSIAEVISQEISTGHWRFLEPPWFVIIGASVGAALAAIGAPLVVVGLTDGRRRRRQAIDGELRLLSAPTVELAPAVGPDGAVLGVVGHF
jgi:hypothetical protein